MRTTRRARLLAAATTATGIVIGSSLTVQPARGQAGAAGSTLAGVYTDAQRARGEKVYADKCLSCHRAELTGGSDINGDIPPLIGPSFATGWRGRRVGELFEWVSESMPPTGPPLARQEYADVLAFIFSRNRLPAGQQELPADMAALNLITVEGSAAAAEAPPTPNRSVLDGVFTQAQSRRGKKAYDAVCAGCHAPSLEGNAVVPALAGTDFLGRWERSTVGDLFERIRSAMPPDAPGSLSDADYTDIVAFLLERNKFRTGQRELEASPVSQRMIWLETSK